MLSDVMSGNLNPFTICPVSYATWTPSLCSAAIKIPICSLSMCFLLQKASVMLCLKYLCWLIGARGEDVNSTC